MSITPKNWNEFQHYKDRKPAWIKLHHALLDDYEFSCLHVASRALAPCIWLLASEYEGGKITATNAEIAFRLRMPVQELEAALKPLIDSGFLLASEPLADRYQVAIPEREGERDKDAGASAPHSDERDFFERGKQILGASSGGLLKNLLKSKGGSVAMARAAIETASTKQDAREYVGRIIRGPPQAAKPLSPFGTEYPEGFN